MMIGITLALNAAEARLQIAASDSEGRMLFAQEWQAESKGTELLAPALHSALHILNIPVQDIARVACVHGPGNFTGLRLVLATAAGLSRAVNAEQGGIPYLPLLAYNALAGIMPDEGTLLWTLSHARRGLVYGQGFRVPSRNADPCAPVCGVAVLRLAENSGCADFIARHSGASPLLLLGSGVSRNENYFAEHLPQANRLPSRLDHPTPAVLLEYARNIPYGREDIPPMYIRPCDAEENLPEIAASLRLDPQKAQQKLRKLTSAFPVP